MDLTYLKAKQWGLPAWVWGAIAAAATAYGAYQLTRSSSMPAAARWGIVAATFAATLLGTPLAVKKFGG